MEIKLKDSEIVAELIESVRHAAVDNQRNCCVNCRITNVPLYLGLDGRLHCADHIGLLVQDTDKTHDKPEQPAEEEHHG